MQRYTLDLSALFSDYRAKTFVRRRSQWNRVRCLQDHIRATFQIEPECYLTNEADVFFPEAEDLDVIQEGDLIRVRVSNSCGTQQKSALKKVSSDEARAQNGKRKHVSTSSSGDDSSSDSDDDDRVETLPKIFAGVEKTCKTKDDEAKLEAKPKRKRVRKRKSKKKVEESPPPKVVVKTYGKTKTPPTVVANGDSSGHVRFEGSDKDEDEVASVKFEPYRNLNRTVTPRVVKAVRVENGQSWNDDIPAVPEYDGGCVEEVKQVVNGAKSRSRKPAKKSVEIKQETIQAATQPQRDPSPTWDTEVSQDPGKESFIANYSGTEFWASLRASVENFPSIPFPSANDVIAYNVRDTGESYLAFVEHVDEGDASRLTIRRLNCSDAASTESATLKQLTEIRLVATYQPA
ncbi:hypothetical protein quinque_009231 [Culex quinquefasciatus]